MKKDTKYLQVDPDFYEIAEVFLHKNVKVFYFGVNNELEESKGILIGFEKSQNGEFLDIDQGKHVRLDRVITINGKPGPAYDEYNDYSINCTSCLTGFEGKA